MLKVLLISDTHGNLDIINETVRAVSADMVIHAGDFGFYTEDSIPRLSPRELRLLVVHSPLRDQYNVDKQTPREELVPIIVKHNLLGDFSDYLSGKKKFLVPVYAVWGNHEDLAIVEQLRSSLTIENLQILDENNFHEIFDDNDLAFKLFGIGGNFIVSKKLFDQPIGGNAGKVWSTLHQFGALYKKLEHKSRPSIFVSHVSPGKEPLLARLISHFFPNIWLSGHMGAPYTCVWNEFTIREFSETKQYLESAVEQLNNLGEYEALLSDEGKLAFEVLQRPLPPEKNWYKKTWNFNLPDAKDGYAILEVDAGKFSLHTVSKGMSFGNTD